MAKAYKPGGSHPQADAELNPAFPAPDPDCARLETDLAERLGTPVTLNYDANGRGRLIVEFADLEILEGVLERLGYQP